MALSSLDHFIDGLEPVPTELQRNFNLMKELDKRTSELVQKISTEVTDYKKKSKTSERSAIFKDIMNQFDRAKEYSDDKIELAVQTYELIDKHIRRLDSELVKFDRECRERYSSAINNQNAGDESVAETQKSETSTGKSHIGKHKSSTNFDRNSNNNSSPNAQDSSRKRVGNRRKYPYDSPDTCATQNSMNESPNQRSHSSKKARRCHDDDVSNSKLSNQISTATGANMSPIAALTGSTPLAPGAASALLLSSTSGTLAGLPGLVTANGEPIAVDMPIDPNEPTYCTCHNVSHGEMIACDNKDCPIEWFHFSCVNLDKKPKGNWYCPQCYNNYKSKRKH